MMEKAHFSQGGLDTTMIDPQAQFLGAGRLALMVQVGMKLRQLRGGAEGKPTSSPYDQLNCWTLDKMRPTCEKKEGWGEPLFSWVGQGQVPTGRLRIGGVPGRHCPPITAGPLGIPEST